MRTLSTTERKSLQIRVIGLPEPQARPRVFRIHGRVVTHSPKSSWFSIVYAQALAARPPAPLDFPLNLMVLFIYPRPKSARKESDFKSTRPDLDNLIKSVKDALTQARWWTDDGRVAVMTVAKRFARGEEPAGAHIYAETIAPG